MDLVSLLPPARIVCDPNVGSKKRALETLSSLVADSVPGLHENDIFNCLLEREHLGTTGLGRGVAIPHGRLTTLSSAAIAMIKLKQGIDYDAPDAQPVDILFALLIPQEHTEEHLQILSQLAEMLSDSNFTNDLRKARNSESLYAVISAWPQDTAA